MKRITSYLLAIAMLVAVSAFFTSCQEDAPEINYTMNVSVVNDFSKVVEAINNGTLKNEEAIKKLADAIDKMNSDQAGKLQAIIDVLNSINATIDTKLAAIEAAMKAQTLSFEGKLSLLETAVKNQTIKQEEMGAKLATAIDNLKGSLAEKLDAVKEIIESTSKTNAEKLVAIEAAIRAQTLSLEGKLQALEAAIKAMPDYSDKLEAIKTVIESFDKSNAERLTAIENAMKAQTLTLTEKLALIEAALKAQTLSLEEKLQALEAAIKALPDYSMQLQAIEVAIKALPNYSDKLSAIEVAIKALPDYGDKLSAIEVAIKALPDYSDKFDAVVAALSAMKTEIEALGTAQGNIATQIANTITAINNLIAAVNNGNTDAADALAQIIQKLEELKQAIASGSTPPGDILNPLSFVAEYNVNPAGTGFVNSLTDCTVSGYFNFDDAVDQFTNITIGGKQYHLPSIEEWHSIVPQEKKHVRFTNTESYNDISETVTVQGTSITMTSDFRTGVSGISYALRYKGTDMVSAWRYEYIENGDNTHMKITSRSLKGQTGVTVEDIAKPAFWSANGDNDVTRHFPASGDYNEGWVDVRGMRGYFWSSSLLSSSNAWGMQFSDKFADSHCYNSRSIGFSVRLFASGGDTPPEKAFNPLSLVAEYNVNPAGTGFVTSLTDCTGSGYFTFNEAVSKFTPIIIGGKQYHLPSIEEWRSIVPKNPKHVRFKETKSYNDISETVTVQGTSITMTSDFRAEGNGVSYALRYKGTDMVSAWRYEYIENGNNTHMKITSRSLKGQTGVTVEDIAKPAFWSANGDNDVTRHFPASGYYWEGSLNYVDEIGSFWSSSSYDHVNAWRMDFNSICASSGDGRGDNHGYSVRLFSSGD